MMRILSQSLIFASILSVFFLASCVMLKAKPNSIETCKAHCKKSLTQCQSVCRDSSAQCHSASNLKAARHFWRFKNQKLIQGDLVGLELQSFRDPLQCLKTTCECDADHEVCKQSCKGIVHKRLQVLPSC